MAIEYCETPWFGGYTKIMSVFILLALPQMRGVWGMWKGGYDRKISEMLLVLFKT